MRPQRAVAPGTDGAYRRVPCDRVVSGRDVEENLFDVLDLVDPERLHLPEPLRPESRIRIVRRVEDVVEPSLRLGVTRVLAEVKGDRERRVVEDLPVVDRIGAALV